MTFQTSVRRPPRLQEGDRVRLVSPASPPKQEGVERFAQLLEEWGLRPEIARHAFDRHGSYLAGKDATRLEDLNEAIRDPDVRAIFATRGGAGSYRIADSMDFDAMSEHPKLLVGFSDITALQLALWRNCQIPSIHGGMYAYFGRLPKEGSAEKLRQAVMGTEHVHLHTRSSEPTAQLTRGGKAEGILIGGNQDMVATSAGWTLPSFGGAILLLEDIGKSPAFIDRQLTRLAKAGHLEYVRGVVVGQYIPDPKEADPGEAVIDVLREHLERLEVPLLGGIPVGHDNDAEPVPLGTWATLDATCGTLTVEAAVK